jgi:hypothetical protein
MNVQMTRALRRLAAAVVGLLLVAGLASPCPCPSPDTMREAEHACCAPPDGVRAVADGCCDEQPAPREVSLSSPPAGLVPVLLAAAGAGPVACLPPDARRPVVLALTPPAAQLRL